MTHLRRLSCALAVVLLLSTVQFIAVLGSVAPPASAVAPIRVMLLGDSIAQGFDGDYTWRYRLWQHLQAGGGGVDFVGPSTTLYDGTTGNYDNEEYADPDFDRDHASHAGGQLSQLLGPDPAATGLEPLGQLMADFQPDVIVMGMGFADMSVASCTPAQVQALVRRFVSEARTSDPGVDIVLESIVPLAYATAPDVPQYDQELAGLAVGLSTTASRVVAAALPDAFDPRTDTWDTVHPTATGEVKIAAVVADALAKVGVGTPFARPLPTVLDGPAHPASELTASAGDAQVLLTWRIAPGQTGEYVWRRDVTANNDWVRLGLLDSRSLTTYTASGLTNGHDYEFRLQAVKGTSVATMRYSATVRARPLDVVVPKAVAPVAMRKPRVTKVHGRRVWLKWVPVAAADRYLVQVQVGGDWLTRATTARPRAKTHPLGLGAQKLRVQAYAGSTLVGLSPGVKVRVGLTQARATRAS